MPNEEGYGFLYPVKAADKKENGPSVTGTAVLNGQEVQVAGWTKKANASGTKYLSLKFQGHELTAVAAAPDAAEDDILF